jgi:hypothetical protein
MADLIAIALIGLMMLPLLGLCVFVVADEWRKAERARQEAEQ